LAAQSDFPARRDSIRAFFTGHDIGSNYAAATARTLDAERRESGLAMLRELTSTVSSDIVERWRMTAAYVHTRDLLTDSLRERIHYIWKRFPVRPLQGEHEHVAYFTALYLAARSFPQDAGFFNGKSRDENARDARAFLLHWMKESTELGQREFDSPTYGGIFLVSCLLLRDFSDESDLSRRADIMAQWLLADFAHDHLNGNYCGAHGREHMMGAMQPISTEMSSISWLYFGDGPQPYSREQLLAALSDFTPHPAIVELATVRREAYESWERKRSAERVRSGTRSSGRRSSDEEVVRYTYMNPLYAIGSIPGGLVQPREQHSWDVTWISRNPEHPATLFVMQPWSDPDALLPFLPHGGEIALRNVGMVDGYWGTVTKTVGGSPFEDVFQHKSTLIALYDIGDISRFPVIAGFFPPAVDSMHVDTLNSGWITIDAGDVYIGVYPLKSFRLVDGMFGKRFLSARKRNGVIVQVAGRNVIGSFSDFMKKIHASRPDTSAFEADRRVRYTTIFGDALDFTFDGARSVNGTTPSMPADLLFSSPWLTSKTGSGILTIHASRGDVHIDMNTLELRSSD
ncbi:MAG: hypothetical protein RRA94_12250, partial [Bacteroidota bacterium]|nr:hypothetical protein [Bacteroidota bacterium]